VVLNRTREHVMAVRADLAFIITMCLKVLVDLICSVFYKVCHVKNIFVKKGMCALAVTF